MPRPYRFFTDFGRGDPWVARKLFVFQGLLVPSEPMHFQCIVVQLHSGGFEAERALSECLKSGQGGRVRGACAGVSVMRVTKWANPSGAEHFSLFY